MTRILLAEDEDVLRMLIVDTLEDEGFQIDEAADGEEAEELAKHSKYDLILLDYMMPGKTGLEVIVSIRENEMNKQTNVMMLTAKSQQSDQKAAMDAGANYFFTKPFSPMELAEKVREIVE
ncbi:response regulator transcription factor [Rossellomorea aquimaris]|uniref:response regulator transcription factor n=1 Tax=Rossellomorea aquimaris TaxID=189382 RepID=UPI0007D04F5C|nr:response regulator [Rossellomorea aquimaris]